MIAAALLALSISPFARLDAEPGLLPKNVVPTSYVIDVAPDPQTMKIAGHEKVTVVVRSATRTIVLNALQTTFGRTTLDGMPATVTTNEKKQQATLAFAKPVAPGTHTLDISYTSTLQTSAQGLFKQKYADMHGKPTFMYGTQLENTDARRVFPSWDEPAFRARFRVSFVVPSAWTAVSNTPAVSVKPAGPGLKRVQFGTTPPMSTYLVVLCAGDFERISTLADGIKLSVYATHGKAYESKYALSVMKDLMPYYDSYYGIKFPLPKLDTIAIPGGFLGAMENWGGITYNESTILWDPKIQPASDQRGIFGIIAHEESHQWNGDLTSFGWWDDVWLAEGFATWMETKAPDNFHPEWHMYIMNDGAVQGAMDADGQLSEHPVYIPVHNETEASEAFDEISYTKAGALLRMLEQYIGPKRFQAGLQYFFRTHEYTYFSASDLWKDLSEQSGTDIAALTHNWIYKAGFPVITASAACTNGKRTISLAQQRYLNDVRLAAGSTVWTVPINFQPDATSGATKELLLDTRTKRVAGGVCNTPFVLNGDAVGYYRVKYDAKTQAAQQAAFRKFSTADKLNLLADSRAFALSGLEKINAYLAYAKADTGDSDPLAVNDVLGSYDSMLSYEKGRPNEPRFKAYIAKQIKPMLARFGGWDGTGMNDDQLQTRNTILYLLARCDDADTIAEAKRRFAMLVTNPQAFPPLTKQAVMGIAGYAADATIYQQLMSMAQKATNPTEMQNDFFSAFSAKDPQLAQQSLNMSLHLPAQFAPYAPYIVIIVGQQHPQMAWKFLNDNSAKLFDSMSAFEKVGAVSGVAGSFGTLIPADQIGAYLKAHVPPAGAGEVKKAMDGVRTRQAQKSRLLPQLDAFIQATAYSP
jgi:aminopeptidase N